MEPRPLRIAYFIEFLMALVAFFEGWSQVGGQGSIDNMPWWLKLLFALSFAFVTVRVTMAAVANDPSPSVPLLRWAMAMLLLLLLLAYTTSSFQPADQTSDESDDPVTTSASFDRLPVLIQYA